MEYSREKGCCKRRTGRYLKVREKGRKRRKEGKFMKGIIRSDHLCNIKYKNGNIYSGMVLNEKPHGKGFLSTAKGDIFEGLFEHGNFLKPLPGQEIPRPEEKKEKKEKSEKKN